MTPVEELYVLINSTFSDTVSGIFNNVREEILLKEKHEMAISFENGKQAQWESYHMKKGMQPHNVTFDEYYQNRYKKTPPIIK